MKRRDFIIQGTTALGMLGVSGKPNFVRLFSFFPYQAYLTVNEDELLSDVLEVLFPHEADSPGASDLGAIFYFRWLFTDPLTSDDDKERIRHGLVQFQKYLSKNGIAVYRELSLEKQGEIFSRYLENEKHERWAGHVMTFLFEALLGDPVYGGNREMLAWKWLEHIPGFPRISKPLEIRR